jgi:hypothetical protein
VMQLLGTALLKTEMCEQLGRLGRGDEIPPNLVELRSALEDTIVELRLLMVEVRNLPTDPQSSHEKRAA